MDQPQCHSTLEQQDEHLSEPDGIGGACLRKRVAEHLLDRQFLNRNKATRRVSGCPGQLHCCPRKAGAAPILLSRPTAELGEDMADQLLRGLRSLATPAADLGLAALAAAFAIRGGPDKGIEKLFDFAAPYFPLFFVPAAVGVIANLDVLTVAWVAVATAVVLGTTATILVTGLLGRALLQLASEKTRA